MKKGLKVLILTLTMPVLVQKARQAWEDTEEIETLWAGGEATNSNLLNVFSECAMGGTEPQKFKDAIQALLPNADVTLIRTIAVQHILSGEERLKDVMHILPALL